MIPVKKSVRSETRFHQTLLLVHELNLLCLGIKRGSFDKKAWVSIFLAISYQRLSFLKVGHACFFYKKGPVFFTKSAFTEIMPFREFCKKELQKIVQKLMMKE